MPCWGPYHRRGGRSVAPGGGTNPIFAWLVLPGARSRASGRPQQWHAQIPKPRRETGGWWNSAGASSAVLFPRVRPTAQGRPPLLWDALYILNKWYSKKLVALGYIGPRTMCGAFSPGHPPWVSTQSPSYNPGPASVTLGCPLYPNRIYTK